MKIRLLPILALFPLSALAQTGPGGVGNSGSNPLWLMSDYGVFSDAGSAAANNGDGVYQWNDVSGNSNHASQTNSSNRPIYVLNAQNGLPAFRMTGDMFVDGPSLGISSTSSYTYLVAFRDTSINSTGTLTNGNGDYILDRTTPTNDLISLKAESAGGYGYQKRNSVGGGLGGTVTSTSTNSNAKVIQLRRDYNTNYQLFYNNNLESTITDSDGATTPPNPRIGRHTTNSNQGLRGYMNEVIIFDFELNSAQTIIVNNYLAAKYDITLSANSVYAQSSGANGDYDFYVAGIGRVDASNLHDDAQGRGIIRISNPSGLGNDEFLMWGRNSNELTANETSDIPVGLNRRLDQTWRVSEVNTSGSSVDVGSVDISVDISSFGNYVAADLRLLIDTDNDGFFNDETAISGTPNGNYVDFTSITDLVDGTRFTIGSVTSPTIASITLDPTGPAGVGSADGTTNLNMWYKPDNGVSVSGTSVDAMTNSAGYADHDMASSGTNRPTLLSNSLNGYDVLSFGGTDYMETTGSLTTSNFVNSEASSFLVSNRNAQTASRPYTTYPTNSNRFSCHVTWSNGRVYFDIGSCCGTSARLEVPSLTGFTSYSFWSYTANSAEGKDLYRNGSLLQSRANTSTYTSHASNTFRIGQSFNGNISELIIFSERVNDAQRIIIENYISAKFDITNNGTDVYTQDDNANGDFDHEVAGIGRIDASNTHEDAQGSGLVRIMNPSDLNDGEFLMWGHDNGSEYYTETSDIPGSLASRMDRVWRVSELNTSGTAIDVGNIDLLIDFDDNACYDATTLSLLVDTDNDGNFNDETPITGAIDLGNGVYQFSSVSQIVNGRRFTFGNSARDIVWDGVSYTGGAGTGGAPGAGDTDNRLVIDGAGAIISVFGSVNEVWVSENGDLTINNGIALSVDECIINDNSITTQNSASIQQLHTGVSQNGGTGTYYINRDGKNSGLSYNIWSSPISSADIISTYGAINPCDVFVFDEAIQFWNHDYTAGFSTTCGVTPVTFTAADVITGGDGIMDVGRGYFIPGISGSTRTFTGTINDGDITYPVITTNLGNKPDWNDDDWNLIGNPYPSAISASDFWNLNAVTNGIISDAVYYWDDNGTGSGYNPTTDYASWNLGGGVSSGNSATVPNGNVSSGQGFWVVAAANGNVEFNNSMRVATNTQFFKNEGEDSQHNVWVGFRSPAGLQNNILVGYNPICSDDYDPSYDAQKAEGNADIKLASQLNGRDYVIQTVGNILSGESKHVPLTVFSSERGMHQFYKYKEENLPQGLTIYLWDREHQIYHDLTKSDYFTNLNGGVEYRNRFELVFDYGNENANPNLATSINDLENPYNIQYQRDGEMMQITHTIEESHTVRVIDMLGKSLITKQNEASTNLIQLDFSSYSHGVYIIQIELVSGEKIIRQLVY